MNRKLDRRTESRVSSLPMERNDNTKSTVESIGKTPLRDIGEVRIPLMTLFVGAAFLSFMIELPAWMILLIVTPAALVFSFIRERKLLVELLSVKWMWASIAPAIGFGIYFVFDMTLQLIANVAMKDGVLALDSSLPAVFGMLLALRGQVEGLHPMTLGIVGGLLLSFGEAVFWRGFLQTRFMLHFGHVPAVFVSAFLYAVFYFFILGPMAAVMAFVLGFAFSFLTLQARSLVPSIVCHLMLCVLALWLRPDFGSMFQ